MSHKCFVSYHADDKSAVVDFCSEFGGSFIHRGIAMQEDIINSDNTDYVMKRIRELYLVDSTVTIVLIGRCTWARRFVDWEIQASLRNPADAYPNGLVAIQLWGSYTKLPPRVKLNVDGGYAKFYKRPTSSSALERIIDEAFDARFAKDNLIENPRERFKYNKQC